MCSSLCLHNLKKKKYLSHYNVTASKAGTVFCWLRQSSITRLPGIQNSFKAHWLNNYMLLQVMLECNTPRRLDFCGHSDWATPLPFRTQGVQNARSLAMHGTMSCPMRNYLSQIPIMSPLKKPRLENGRERWWYQGRLTSRGRVGMECWRKIRTRPGQAFLKPS